jgi:hypothetical protein
MSKYRLEKRADWNKHFYLHKKKSDRFGDYQIAINVFIAVHRFTQQLLPFVSWSHLEPHCHQNSV